MRVRLFPSESKFLERTRTALTNAEAHAEIKALMANFGMDENKLLEGRNLYEQARSIKERHEQEGIDSRLSSNAYREVFENLQALYKRHRDLVRIFFKRQPDILIRLGVTGKFPTQYNSFFDQSGQYYKTIQNNPDLQEKLMPLNITPEVVGNSLSRHQELVTARASFDRESGELQEATQQKNRALIQLKEWMDDFDTIAKVALYDQPQLLEVLGIFVRS